MLTQDRDYEQAARDEQARLVIENRVSKYISKVTGGRDLIDPTGRAPPSDVQPSQLVEVPDYTFGQGKSVKIPDSSMKRITERIRSELKVDKEDLGEYKRLVTGLLQETGKEGVATLHGRKLKGSETGGVVSFASAAGGGGGEVIGSIDLKEEELREARNEQERRLAELQGLASVLGSVPGAAGSAVDVNMGWGNTYQHTLLCSYYLPLTTPLNALGNIDSTPSHHSFLSHLPDEDVEAATEAQRLLKLSQEDPLGATNQGTLPPLPCRIYTLPL